MHCSRRAGEALSVWQVAQRGWVSSFQRQLLTKLTLRALSGNMLRTVTEWYQPVEVSDSMFVVIVPQETERKLLIQNENKNLPEKDFSKNIKSIPTVTQIFQCWWGFQGKP